MTVSKIGNSKPFMFVNDFSFSMSFSHEEIANVNDSVNNLFSPKKVIFVVAWNGLDSADALRALP